MAPVAAMRPAQDLRRARPSFRGWIPVLPIGILLLGTCAQPPEPTLPPPVPQVAVSPSLEATVASWVRAYRDQIGVPEFDLVPLADTAIFAAAERGEVTLAITGLEPPQGWFATPLAAESLAVVLHPSNPVRDLSLEQLADLFTGRAGNWSALGGEEIAVQPVVLPPGDALRERFDSAVLKDARVWPGAQIAPSPEAVLELVRSDRGAIGYLPASQLAGSLRVVRLDGTEPQAGMSGSASYPLSFTIVATAPQEPEGFLREFLVWLQAEGSLRP